MYQILYVFFFHLACSSTGYQKSIDLGELQTLDSLMQNGEIYTFLAGVSHYYDFFHSTFPDSFGQPNQLTLS